eukprot:1875816-Alexandrium_andersonii.AAC.1
MTAPVEATMPFGITSVAEAHLYSAWGPGRPSGCRGEALKKRGRWPPEFPWGAEGPAEGGQRRSLLWPGQSCPGRGASPGA